VVSAADGIDYAYRQTGQGAPPLVLLQHFRGNLDNWDPALVDALAATRQVVTFDNTGVGASTGTAPNTVAQIAYDAIAFLDSMGLPQVDLLTAGRGGLPGHFASSMAPVGWTDWRPC
jgi:pimeloyl-ACP methyl ester carboxylesterase